MKWCILFVFVLVAITLHETEASPKPGLIGVLFGGRTHRRLSPRISTILLAAMDNRDNKYAEDYGELQHIYEGAIQDIFDVLHQGLPQIAFRTKSEEIIVAAIGKSRIALAKLHTDSVYKQFKVLASQLVNPNSNERFDIGKVTEILQKLHNQYKDRVNAAIDGYLDSLGNTLRNMTRTIGRPLPGEVANIAKDNLRILTADLGKLIHSVDGYYCEYNSFLRRLRISKNYLGLIALILRLVLHIL